MDKHTPQPNERRTNGGRLASYEVRPSAGLGNMYWPTGFSGGGWAVLDSTGTYVLCRWAFRTDALRALALADDLVKPGTDVGALVQALAADTSSEPDQWAYAAAVLPMQAEALAEYSTTQYDPRDADEAYMGLGDIDCSGW